MLSCATAITDDVILWSITSRWCQAVIMSNCHYWWCHPVSLSLLMMLCCDIDLSDVILCNCHYWWCHPVRYHIMMMSNCHHAKRWSVDAEIIISATFSTEAEGKNLTQQSQSRLIDRSPHLSVNSKLMIASWNSMLMTACLLCKEELTIVHVRKGLRK